MKEESKYRNVKINHVKSAGAQKEEKMGRKWTKITAENYIKTAKQKGLTYWSAIDFLKHHSTMHSII